ncbi:hypothetical protein Vadar_013836 [Vaccinium darrowii]|uniref:Uncharacterized protein n=1 Tax=Vaccinium darrowii TaxID=229202 RepID=A0ACB7XZQ5_9ERIC|nr:hypothetical protein Vadar_013836 [Vaccinium darrowii]
MTSTQSGLHGSYTTGSIIPTPSSSLSIPNVFYVPQLSLSLLSISQLSDSGFDVLFSSSGCVVQDRVSKKQIGTGRRVYIIRGDGTQKGASVIYEVIDKSFGFDTAVEEAQRAINAAHVEAESTENGVGVVKLMGRYSGSYGINE